MELAPPYNVFPPKTATSDMLFNACRVAAVNANYPGAITYDPYTTYLPQGVTTDQIIYAWYRAAVLGELQS